ncbi:hypothetical protein BJX76DRAFT_325761 [Aspergillus varians]
MLIDAVPAGGRCCRPPARSTILREVNPIRAEYGTIVSDPVAVRLTTEFMLKTSLLGQIRKVKLEPQASQGPLVALEPSLW